MSTNPNLKPVRPVMDSPQVIQAIQRKKKTMKDISLIQSVYGKSTQRCVDRHIELRRKIHRTNFNEELRRQKNWKSWKEELSMVQWRQEWIPVKPPQQPLDLCHYTWVNNNEKYWAMHHSIRQEKVITVDVEANEWDTYSGIICLIQVSTTRQNFIIDSLAVPQELADNFGEILEDPDVLKVMHGSHNDLRWLQRDFGIFLGPLLDTQELQAPDCPELSPGIGFAALVMETLGIEITKKEKVLGQLSDYTHRPLHSDLCRYACNDSRLLLHVFNQLASKIDFTASFEKSLKIMQNAKWASKIYPSVSEVIPGYVKSAGNSDLFQKLYKYREIKSKLQDMPPEKLIPSQTLATAACRMTLPKNCPLRDEISCVIANKDPAPKTCQGLCFRCGKFAGHDAKHCTEPKAKRSEVQKLYYKLASKAIAVTAMVSDVRSNLKYYF